MEQGGVAADQIEIVSLRLQLLPASDTLWAYCSLRGVVPIECWSWTNFREPKEMFWCDLRIHALTVASDRATDAMIDTRSEQPRPRSWANEEYDSKLAENFKTFGKHEIYDLRTSKRSPALGNDLEDPAIVCRVRALLNKRRISWNRRQLFLQL